MSSLVSSCMSIYQFLIVVRRSDIGILTSEAGEVTSHLQGMFTRTARLLTARTRPIYVFDGQTPELKKKKEREKELVKRFLKKEDTHRISKND